MGHRFRTLLLAIMGILALVAAAPSTGMAQIVDSVLVPEGPAPASPPDTIDRDVPFVATSHRIVNRMLEVASVSSTDVVYDLGSGDGRIPITAAMQHDARGVGIEIDPDLVAEGRARAKEVGVANQVEFRQKNLFKADLSEATVVTLYLWPEINVELRPKLLQELDPGDRIVSHDFRMGDWEPAKTIRVEDSTGRATLYLWKVPEEIPRHLMTTTDELPEN
ncbi:MAG: cyclopropane-fatty-acyl-phospholipid synthase family protein [Salinibacter sp.]|uniref:SAM-dependent methyltransferase n=1 Tax=Salinibacter sp. TaxID=2065818 RepID=UPI0035D456B7